MNTFFAKSELAPFSGLVIPSQHRIVGEEPVSDPYVLNRFWMPTLEYKIDESKLVLGRDAILESFGRVGVNELVLLDGINQRVREAVEALSREQYSLQMYSADYFNAEKTVNFPLTAAKLADFSKLDGMRLLGALDPEGKLCAFANYFLKEWPAFAGELKQQADLYCGNQDPKTYLYLVLVRPEQKSRGLFQAMWHQEELESKRQGNTACAIEIHQVNAPSSNAHCNLTNPFQWMGTVAVHERTDVTGEVLPLRYRQYCRRY